jgi:hypothetical protein
MCTIGLYAPIPVQDVLDIQNSTRVTRNSGSGQVLSVPLYEVGQTEPGGNTENGGVLHIFTSM